MTIESIAAAAATETGGIAAPATVATAQAAPPGVFDNLVTAMQGMSAQMTANQQGLQSLALGDTDQLHRVMMNLESTRLTFDLALQVRNRVLEAYQEMMRMQI